MSNKEAHWQDQKPYVCNIGYLSSFLNSNIYVRRVGKSGIVCSYPLHLCRLLAAFVESFGLLTNRRKSTTNTDMVAKGGY